MGITPTKVLVSLLELWKAEGRVRSQLFPLLPWPLIICPRHDASSAQALGLDKVWAGLQTCRTHNSPSKSCYPSPRTNRRVLMMSGIHQLLSIIVIYRFPRLFTCPRHVPGAAGRRNVASLNISSFVFPTFNGLMEIERW